MKAESIMTFEPLQQIYKYRRKIWNTQDTLDIVISRNTAPKNQILSDMPKSGTKTKREIEEYVIRKEALLCRLKRQKETLYILWIAFLNIAESAELTRSEISLLRLRYFHGYRWKKCLKKLQQLYPAMNWNDNRVFRVHKSVISRLNNYYYDE